MADIPANATTTAVLEGSSFTGSFSGQVEKPGDHDWIKVNLIAGETYDFYLCFLDFGSVTNGDSILTLRDATGVALASDDNGGVGLNSFLSFAAPSTGTFFIEVGETSRVDRGS
jgi:serralysin